MGKPALLADRKSDANICQTLRKVMFILLHHSSRYRRYTMSKNFYANTLSTNPAKTSTPQTQALPGREAEMVANNAGGFTFQLDAWGYLDRFLILGSDKPSYYASAQKLTKDAAKNVIKCIGLDGVRTVNRIVEISQGGRAPKNYPAVFALALCAINGNPETVAAAYAALPKVARIGTHLFQFVAALDELGKWNAAAKRGVAQWYTKRPIDRLATQLIKYQSRDGWAHRDVLRLAHVKPTDELQSAAFRYVVKGAEGIEKGTGMPALIVDFETLKREPTKKNALRLIAENKDFSWEMIPTELMRDTDVMAALLPNMGMTALIRQLGRLTNIGVIKPLSSDMKVVLSKLTDTEAIKAGRIHPITILNAFNQYKTGHGDKGSLTWTPVQQVLDALNDAFYDSFQYVESTGQGHLIGVDCSGSMFCARVSGANNLTAAEVAGVMALAVAKREPNYWIGGFNTKMGELKITPSMRLDNVLQVMQRFLWGGTDCALPMLHALEHKMDGVNKFVVITDNETWAGNVQPVEALARYRKKYVKDAKLIVCGTSSTNFTIADPKDPGMLDIVGFDSAAPMLIQSF
jgi:60 kDa SS-A/Ro ribonucleoprotein